MPPHAWKYHEFAGGHVRLWACDGCNQSRQGERGRPPAEVDCPGKWPRTPEDRKRLREVAALLPEGSFFKPILEARLREVETE